jgi:hypothetical protein
MSPATVFPPPKNQATVAGQIAHRQLKYLGSQMSYFPDVSVPLVKPSAIRQLQRLAQLHSHSLDIQFRIAASLITTEFTIAAIDWLRGLAQAAATIPRPKPMHSGCGAWAIRVFIP